ncbi:MAG: iron-containing alcohol dehydrogenase [Candidatus Limiplasma sp.]|nr:iron-containing alcohol dehydrogenase [Candidatus Limiplasma sp.]
MKNVMIGANRYVRGSGALALLGELSAPLGRKALVIGGKTALSKTLDAITHSLQSQGIGLSVAVFQTEVCKEQAYALREAFLREKADFVIGVGGGKALDLSKWVADLSHAPCVTVPTCASTCACMVSLIVTYHASGLADQGLYAANSPWLCLADTAVLAAAPQRLLFSGIADTLSKWPETRYAMREAPAGVFNFLTASLGRNIYDTLLAKGPSALSAPGDGPEGSALEEVLDIIFFMSALVGNTAGDAYRLAIAHSLHDGLIAVRPQVIHSFYHGEKVGYGTLVQLALLEPEVGAEHLQSVYSLLHSWGLPVSLRDFGLTDSPADVNALVEATRGPKIRQGPSHTSLEALERAIRRIEALRP